MISGSTHQQWPACQLFGTLGCHLCEQAEALLMPWVADGLQVECVDITDQVAHYERYERRIPVLQRQDTGAELNWPFDIRQLQVFLSR